MTVVSTYPVSLFVVLSFVLLVLLFFPQMMFSCHVKTLRWVFLFVLTNIAFVNDKRRLAVSEYYRLCSHSLDCNTSAITTCMIMNSAGTPYFPSPPYCVLTSPHSFGVLFFISPKDRRCPSYPVPLFQNESLFENLPCENEFDLHENEPVGKTGKLEMAYSVLLSSLSPYCRLYLLSISETLITILCLTFSRLTISPRWMKRSGNSRSLKGKFVNASFFIAIYFIRISRLTFAKF